MVAFRSTASNELNALWGVQMSAVAAGECERRLHFRVAGRVLGPQGDGEFGLVVVNVHADAAQLAGVEGSEQVPRRGSARHAKC